jgi:hypothetical protein
MGKSTQNFTAVTLKQTLCSAKLTTVMGDTTGIQISPKFNRLVSPVDYSMVIHSISWSVLGTTSIKKLKSEKIYLFGQGMLVMSILYTRMPM